MTDNDNGKKKKPQLPHGVTLLTYLVAGAWIGAYIIEYFSPTFEAPASLDPLMLLVVGYYFTNTAVTAKKSEKADE